MSTLPGGTKVESTFFGEELPARLAPGMILADRYELIRKIGSGSMGDVWAARHLSLGEEVAIKLVVRTTASDGSSTASRFLFEARIAAQLSRKTRHIVTVTDHGEHGAYAYLVMELLKGESLDARLARAGTLSPAQVTPVLYQVSRALSVAHADGIIHRDLKTSNVFVTIDEEGRALVKILDFGIAKARGSMRRIPVAAPARATTKHATMDGFLLGTPPYMSPEQACGEAIDHRADVWALAVMAYHLLTGEFPFDGDTPESLLARICSLEPTPISTHRPDLPLPIVQLFARAFTSDIRDRFQSAVDFAHAFELAARDDLRAVSLPPQEPLVIVAPKKDPATLDEPRTIIAAGVPRKRKVVPLVFATLLVLGMLGALAGVLAIYFEPVPTTPGTTTVTMAAPRAEVDRMTPPPPDESPSVDEPAPAAPQAIVAPPAVPASVTFPSTLPQQQPETMTATASVPPPAPRSYDRSEIF